MQYGLVVNLAVVLILHNVSAVVFPRFADIIQHHLVESVKVARITQAVGQMFSRQPLSVVVVVEQGSVNIVVEVMLGEIVEVSTVVSRRTPIGLY